MTIRKVKDLSESCNGCCFNIHGECERPDEFDLCMDGDVSYIYIDDDPDSAVYCITNANGEIINEGSIPDQVNHPTHYNSHPSGVEPIQIIKHENFNIGNVIKYCMRRKFKGKELEDLKKARTYLDMEIEMLEGAQ